jgi:hypothetical protein
MAIFAVYLADEEMGKLNNENNRGLKVIGGSSSWAKIDMITDMRESIYYFLQNCNFQWNLHYDRVQQYSINTEGVLEVV